MNIGMLWFDNDPKAGLAVKVERAATYYRNKYGKIPTLCFVHPSMIPQAAAPEGKNEKDGYSTAGVEIRSHTSVLPNHFWIGVNGSSESTAT
jgi:hypothetical protein